MKVKGCDSDFLDHNLAWSRLNQNIQVFKLFKYTYVVK